jgi:pyridoxal biosynthesis lyase PdxS
MRLALPLGIALGAAACGSSDVPSKQLAESQSAVRAASEVGADHDPQAALHLKMARDQISKAQALNREGEYDAAKQLLKQAELDAELALTLTREKQAKSDEERAAQQLGSLQ